MGLAYCSPWLRIKYELKKKAFMKTLHKLQRLSIGANLDLLLSLGA